MALYSALSSCTSKVFRYGSCVTRGSHSFTCHPHTNHAISVDDVVSSVHKLPDKSSASDPLPTYILKQVIDLLAPFVAELFIDRWLLIISQAPSRMHPLHRCWRSKDSTLPTPAHTVQFPIWRYCRSYWSDWWLTNFIITWPLPTYFRRFSMVSVRATPLKLLFCLYFPTFSWPSTVEILQHWSFWISLLHSTRSTMTSCCRDSRLALASTALLSSGFSPTWLAELSTSVVA